MTAAVRPRRSILYMPGSNARALEKARGLPADGFIFDLEDAVAPDAKELAREQVCAAAESGAYGGRELVIRAHGLAVLDGVFIQLDDMDGFAAECAQGRELGFDGKTLVHPKQIAAANEAFAPGREAVDHARRMIAAYAEAEAQGRGVAVLDGRMVEKLHVENAQRLVALAEAIDALNAE